MKTATNIRKAIQRIPRGTPFLSSRFLELGSRAAVDQALSRLVRGGQIRRLSRGVFVRPSVSPYVGEVLPGAREVAEQLTQKAGFLIQTHGSELARKFGLSTQVPARSVFLTNGPNRTIQIGSNRIHLKHVARRKLGPEHSKAGEVISLLWYLGRRGVDQNVLRKIESHLSQEDVQDIGRSRRFMPSWMVEAIRNSGWIRSHGG